MSLMSSEDILKLKVCHRTIGTAGGSKRCLGDECSAWIWLNKKAGHDIEYWERTDRIQRTRSILERAHVMTPEEALKNYIKENPLTGRCGLIAEPSK